MPRCKSQITKLAEFRFHAVLGDGSREVSFERGIGEHAGQGRFLAAPIPIP